MRLKSAARRTFRKNGQEVDYPSTRYLNKRGQKWCPFSIDTAETLLIY